MARAFRFRVLIGLAVCLGGCVSPEPVAKSTWLDRFRSSGGPQGSDVIVLQIALVEQPPGDPYLDDGLWTDADSQAVALDRAAVLDDNGFRVGLISGIPPVKFLELLTSERSCVNAHEAKLRAGAAKIVHLGAPIQKCQYDVRQGGKPTTVSFDQAQFIAQIVPAITPDGRVKLTITPQVQHGSKPLWPQPADGVGWSLQGNRPAEKCAGLSWDVTLAAPEYVIVGTRFAKPQTLGHSCFVRPDEDRPVQRVLVIRARPAVPAPIAPAETPTSAGVAPLAIRATHTTVRGACP